MVSDIDYTAFASLEASDIKDLIVGPITVKAEVETGPRKRQTLEAYVARVNHNMSTLYQRADVVGRLLLPDFPLLYVSALISILHSLCHQLL